MSQLKGRRRTNFTSGATRDGQETGKLLKPIAFPLPAIVTESLDRGVEFRDIKDNFCTINLSGNKKEGTSCLFWPVFV